MNDDPRPIGESLAFVTRDLGLARPGDASRLVAHWSELVGDALAQHSRRVAAGAGQFRGPHDGAHRQLMGLCRLKTHAYTGGHHGFNHIEHIGRP